MAERYSTVPNDRRIELRIGINMSDIVVEDGDIFGDGVNVAARLEAFAAPGGICVSARVQEDAAGKLDLRAASATAVKTPALPLPDKQSIAALPLQNMSGDPEQEYFADGMAEEIITALSLIRWLFVIARNSSFYVQAPRLRLASTLRVKAAMSSGGQHMAARCWIFCHCSNYRHGRNGWWRRRKPKPSR